MFHSPNTRSSQLPETFTDLLRAANNLGVSAVGFQVEGSPDVHMSLVVPSAKFTHRVFSALQERSRVQGWETEQGFKLSEIRDAQERIGSVEVDYVGRWAEDTYTAFADMLYVASGYQRYPDGV